MWTWIHSTAKWLVFFASGARPEVLLEDVGSKHGTFLNGAIFNNKTSLADVKRQETVKIYLKK
jgi:hypothetical protein